MVIVMTEKYPLFHDEWNLPAAAFWLGWEGICLGKHADWQFACSISVKARSPVGQGVDGMFLWDGK